MTRAERAFAILVLLSDRRAVTATELAERFEVSVRTIYRDVEMLALTGVPVYAERGVKGGYRLMEGYFLPPVGFTRAEAVAALLALALTRSLKVVPFARDLAAAERKMVAAMPAQLRPLLAETARLIGFEGAAGDPFHPEDPPVMPPAADGDATEARAVEVFLTALLDGTRVAIDYRTPYRPRRSNAMVDAEPRGVIWDRDRWYLVGDRLDGPSGDRRRFWRADRVAAIEASTLRAERPPFDVRDQLGRRWLATAMSRWSESSPVRIRMTRAQADRLRMDWLYRFGDFAPDGPEHEIVTYGEAEAAKTYELLRWLGPGSELLSPAAWRDGFRAELEVMAASHAREPAAVVG